MGKIIFKGIDTALVSPLTLSFLVDGDNILTLHRSKNKSVYPGKISGFGGKVEPGEDLFESASREFKEETGLEMINPVLKGTFLRVLEEDYLNFIYIFLITKFKGELRDAVTDEGTIAWRKVKDFASHEDTVDHIKKYILQIADPKADFYSGVGYYKNNSLIEYADNSAHFKNRTSN